MGGAEIAINFGSSATIPPAPSPQREDAPRQGFRSVRGEVKGEVVRPHKEELGKEMKEGTLGEP